MPDIQDTVRATTYPLRPKISRSAIGGFFPMSSFVKFVRAVCLCLLLVFNFSDLAPADQIYSNGFPRDRGFFPIAVWLQAAARAQKYKAIGINTFVGLWNGPTEAQRTELARNEMFVVATQNKVALTSVNHGVIKGWLHDDEPDNAQPIGLGLYGACIPSYYRRSSNPRNEIQRSLT